MHYDFGRPPYTAPIALRQDSEIGVESGLYENINNSNGKVYQRGEVIHVNERIYGYTLTQLLYNNVNIHSVVQLQSNTV